MLVDVLNGLATPGSAHLSYEQAARSLSSDERREATTLHLSALLQSLPVSFSAERIEFPGLSLTLAEVTEGADLAYEDLGLGYRIEGAKVDPSGGPSRMSGLLELLVYARERSDTLTYLPAEMRRERIVDLVKRVGASEPFVRFILAQAPAIERNIAA